MDQVGKYIDSLSTDDNNFKEVIFNGLLKEGAEEDINISLIIFQSKGYAGVSSFLKLLSDSIKLCTMPDLLPISDSNIFGIYEPQPSKQKTLLKAIRGIHENVNIHKKSFTTRELFHDEVTRYGPVKFIISTNNLITLDDIPGNLKNYTRIINFDEVKDENKQYYDYVKNLDDPIEKISEYLKGVLDTDNIFHTHDEEDDEDDDEENKEIIINI